MISVVVPVFRNRETVRELAAQVLAALPGDAVEIVYVNDACPDGSGEVMMRLPRNGRAWFAPSIGNAMRASHKR